MDMWFLNVFEAGGNRYGRGMYVFFDIRRRGTYVVHLPSEKRRNTVLYRWRCVTIFWYEFMERE